MAAGNHGNHESLREIQLPVQLEVTTNLFQIGMSFKEGKLTGQ